MHKHAVIYNRHRTDLGLDSQIFNNNYTIQHRDSHTPYTYICNKTNMGSFNLTFTIWDQGRRYDKEMAKVNAMLFSIMLHMLNLLCAHFIVWNNKDPVQPAHSHSLNRVLAAHVKV